MKNWSPISIDELEALISLQLAECSQEERERFSRCSVPLAPAWIDRDGNAEAVFIVARRGDIAMYYEDIEEGFNLSTLHPDGSIAIPGFEQWSLRIALNVLVPPQESGKKSATRGVYERQPAKKME